MCCIAGCHQKLLPWHVHVFRQSGHSATMPATNRVLLAALTRNRFHSEPKHGPAWSSCLWAAINSKSSAHLLRAPHALPCFTPCLFAGAVAATQISPLRFPARGDSPHVLWHCEAVKLLRCVSPKLLRSPSPEVICCWRTWHLKQFNYNLRSRSSKPLQLTERVCIVLTTTFCGNKASKSQTNVIHKTNDKPKAMTT